MKNIKIMLCFWSMYTVGMFMGDVSSYSSELPFPETIASSVGKEVFYERAELPPGVYQGYGRREYFTNKPTRDEKPSAIHIHPVDLNHDRIDELLVTYTYSSSPSRQCTEIYHRDSSQYRYIGDIYGGDNITLTKVAGDFSQVVSWALNEHVHTRYLQSFDGSIYQLIRIDRFRHGEGDELFYEKTYFTTYSSEMDRPAHGWYCYYQNGKGNHFVMDTTVWPLEDLQTQLLPLSEEMQWSIQQGARILHSELYAIGSIDNKACYEIVHTIEDSYYTCIRIVVIESENGLFRPLYHVQDRKDQQEYLRIGLSLEDKNLLIIPERRHTHQYGARIQVTEHGARVLE